MCSYMMRVVGLGPVEALFLPHVNHDDDTRERVRLCQGADHPMTITGVYRVHRMDLDLPVDEKPASTYLETGIPDEKAGDVKNLFFDAQSVAEAQGIAREHARKQGKLYRCEEVSLTWLQRQQAEFPPAVHYKIAASSASVMPNFSCTASLISVASFRTSAAVALPVFTR